MGITKQKWPYREEMGADTTNLGLTQMRQTGETGSQERAVGANRNNLGLTEKLGGKQRKSGAKRQHLGANKDNLGKQKRRSRG